MSDKIVKKETALPELTEAVLNEDIAKLQGNVKGLYNQLEQARGALQYLLNLKKRYSIKDNGAKSEGV